MKWYSCLIFLAIFSCTRKNSLEANLNELINGKNLRAGIAVIDLKTGNLTAINGKENFPLQSVFKFHIAAKVLDDVDQGNLGLHQSIPIEAAEILENTWSPLRDEHGRNDLHMRLDSLVYYMVALSDNNACDILLRRIGGATAVNEYVNSVGITGTRIEVNEDQMHQDWEAQFRNIATPLSVAEILKKFYLREFLSGDMHNFLWAQMENSPTGKNRLRAGVPAGTVLAHKTGTSGRNAEGMSSATHDAGIILLPDSRAYIVVVFVSDSFESDEVNEKLIADIAAAVTSR